MPVGSVGAVQPGRERAKIDSMATLAEVLEARTVEAAPELVEPIAKGRLRCYACGHECPIPEGAVGVCNVRFNRGGVLHVPWGYVGGVQCDPIEKKPFFHARPGRARFSFGMLGCDLHCSYCQNWVTSQALRDPQAVSPPLDVDPAALVDEALAPRRPRRRQHLQRAADHQRVGRRDLQARRGARGLMTALRVERQRHAAVLDYIRPWIDLYKVDLKSFDDKHYRQLGGRIEPILETIRALHEMGIWLEIVTLLIPGFNDAPEELERLTAFLAGVSPDIPWHVTAFHKDYRMSDPGEHDAGDADERGGRSAAATACATSTRATCRAASATSRTRAVTPAGRCSSSATAISCGSIPPDVGVGRCPECGGRQVAGERWN